MRIRVSSMAFWLRRVAASSSTAEEKCVWRYQHAACQFVIIKYESDAPSDTQQSAFYIFLFYLEIIYKKKKILPNVSHVNVESLIETNLNFIQSCYIFLLNRLVKNVERAAPVLGFTVSETNELNARNEGRNTVTRDRFAAAFERIAEKLRRKWSDFDCGKAEKTQQTASWGGWNKKKMDASPKKKRIKKRNEDGRDDRAWVMAACHPSTTRYRCISHRRANKKKKKKKENEWLRPALLLPTEKRSQRVVTCATLKSD